jgi:Domain of unknown function (DUF4145)
MAFNWQCPFCGRHTTITSERTYTSTFKFSLGNTHGLQLFHLSVIVCPNEECGEYSLILSQQEVRELGGVMHAGATKKEWSIIPPARIKIFPNFIPKVIIDDYKEACLIKELSPKASATLSRRCLQGMIRDFWGISKPRLVDEIEAIKDKVDSITWDAIDSVRKIGNIGAHMEKDINFIIDVDENEAGLLIELIETLIAEWYIARDDREKRMLAIKGIATTKKGKS